MASASENTVDTGQYCCRFNQDRIRARQERNISGVKDGLMEGSEALSKGFVRGMTGIVTKPLEGAKSRGAYGAHRGGACFKCCPGCMRQAWTERHLPAATQATHSALHSLQA